MLVGKGVFLVVGGSRGIGEAVAVRAAAAGHPVVLTYADRPDRAEGVVARIVAAGGHAVAVGADVAVEGDVDAIFDAVADIGPLTAMAFCAGVTGPASPLADAAVDTLSRVIAVNLLGAILCARRAIQVMATRRGGQGGSIVILSSRASDYGSAGEFVWYAASKGGLNSLAIGLAREVAADGVRVNVVSPGPIDTEMHRPGRLDEGARRAPMQRAGTPDEVAASVMFLSSEDAAFVTGATINVSGGL
ncbi:SDR family oxidoreductase [Brevundimonas subvibrioides]|uniref:D-xylose 1-dehydrogenase n=1 Tax=Brevundimonas subvibrioides (strain ATCC 15264 / DSM 4735 / LMG 14903 / NBRC 16000 / CB 81) TaxID=633149 RepID=D9QIN3_BRESC|nr:SDR family oxidoreductase [Brevundimonas subvibrioides]ADL01366.1 short-chain dehydrogenase/reductase SDR [Brevundimonas subvibrioides ATCC 15264]